MIGAIIGDIAGSVYEFNNIRTKDFALLTDDCFATDDTIMTIAIAKAVMESRPDHKDLGKNAVKYMREIGQRYPDCGYGGRFCLWMFSQNPKPYNSFGNGAAMRVSPVAYYAKSMIDVIEMAEAVTEVTHNHPEGIKGARAVAVATWLAIKGYHKANILDFVKKLYPQIGSSGFTLDKIRATNRFDETCQVTVPQALEAFFESHNFEDAIRNAISIGGDSDTIAAITGSVAGAYYGVGKELEEKALSYLDDSLLSIVNDFRERS